ncbi:hypothetical protein DFH06DRAFT_1134981 [Mycena polygramma]|nr:hypothetical protein DFH06DRAFT_1134981 [Mycena polygramma]
MISLVSTFFSMILLAPALGQTSETFLWDKLTQSQDLKWVECYSTFQCTRLEVPLDYSDTSVRTAAIAVIRLPANVSQAEYRGPILFNPGGPGGSGVDTLVLAGSSFPAILGDSRYDFVSFDPRGVHFSTPQASFFESDAERALWNAGVGAFSPSWQPIVFVPLAVGGRDKTQILKYITTDNVARDMLLITQKSGFEKLKYYGLSYGSFLGAIFAAMFPVCSTPRPGSKASTILFWFQAVPKQILLANLTIEATDTDKALQSFFDGCAAAGPDLCAFYESTAAAIADRLEALTNSIRTQPVPVITPAAYGLVDYSLLRSTIFSMFPTLAQSLAALEKGDGAALYAILAMPSFECNCNGTVFPPSDDSTVAIEFGDAAQVTDSIEQVTEFYNNAVKTSQFAELFMGSERVSCTGWQVYRDDRFKGPVAANTSFPLLLIANTAGRPSYTQGCSTQNSSRIPRVCALDAKFNRAHKDPQHTSVSAPSLCTLGYFREYIVNGTLPPPGTVCPVDATLFAPPANSTTKISTLGADDERLLAAAKVIGDSVQPILRKMRHGH